MIHSIRDGFATNSSSTHHIVFCEEPSQKYLSDYEDDNIFGWDFFTLADPVAKCKYFGVLAYQHYIDTNLLNPEDSWYLAQKYFPEIGNFNENDWAGVDHQSRGYFPLNRQKDIKDMWFWLRKFAQNENIYILGGNDNDSEEHPMLINEHFKVINLPLGFCRCK